MATGALVRRFLKGVIVCALALAAISSASAATIQLRAWLNGAQVPLAVSGTGLGTVSFDTATKVLSWSVTYQGLSGACTDAHFHGPASAGVNASPVVGMTCSASPLTGSSAPLNATQEAQLLSGQWYINIHTGFYPGGEIRGQVLPVRGDFNGDGRADVLWRNGSTGENYIYPMNGLAILGTEGYIRTVADQNWQVNGIGDFDGDGQADILWRNFATGENYIYPMNGTAILGSEGYIRTVADLNWKIAGIGDFNGDGRADILWRNETTGENYIYMMNGTTIASEGYIRTVADQSWYTAAVGDFNGDGKSDILWRNDGQASPGQNYIYPMDGLTILPSEGYIRTVADLNWDIIGAADFDGDGRADILWRNFQTGENYIYPMAGLAIRPTEGYLRTVADLAWRIVALGDYDGDGRADILWRNDTTGENYIYPMDGTTILPAEGYVRTVADQNWRVMGVADYEQDQPSLSLVLNFPHGYFLGGTTGQLDYPPVNTYYYANFHYGNDATPAASAYFTGPAGSQLSNTESYARFLSGDGGVGFTSPSQFNVAPPGGVWTVNYEGQNIAFNLPDPDSANRYTSIVPTVTLAGDTLTQIDWIYRNTAGTQIATPAFATFIEIRVDGLVGEQVVRLYERRQISPGTASHVLASSVSWSAVTMVSMVMHDNRGNQYVSYWSRTPPPAPVVNGISPTAGAVGSSVTLTGLNFGCTGCVSQVNAVRFTGPGGSGASGVSAQFTIDSSTQITATVPATALDGAIWVQSIGGTSTSSQSFDVQ